MMPHRLLPRAALVVLVIAGLFAGVVLHDRLNPAAISTILTDLGGLAPAAFVAMFAAATVAFLPGSLFGLVGGALFGPLWGAVWNLLGATLGATIAFLIARHAAADWVAARTGGRMKQIIEGVESEGWRFVALTRLVPIVPFNVLNYALGLTRIPLSHYVLATLACMVPGAAAYSWLGHAGRAAMQGGGAELRYGLLGLALLAAVAFVPRVYRRVINGSKGWISGAQLRRQLAEEAPPLIVDVREPDELIGPLGHIRGAVNIPLSELPGRFDEVVLLRHPVVLVCRTDKRSDKAASMLRNRGLREVKVLRGGMEEWGAKRGAAPAAPLERVGRPVTPGH